MPVICEAFVAPTREEAVDVAKKDEAMEGETDLHRPFDELDEDSFLLGTPASVCTELERYERELDADRVLFRCHWPGLSYVRT